MSTSKRIDIFCIVALVLTVAITILFMCGESLGLSSTRSQEEAESGLFTENDLNADWEQSGATAITLSGDSATVSGGGAYYADNTVHIVSAGKYLLSGSFTGSVLVEASKDDKIWLLFDGVSLTSDNDAPLHIEQAGKVFLTLKSGTENTVTYQNTDEAAVADGALYSRDDLTINGSGSLTVSSAALHGIVCNDTLILTGGTLDITAKIDAVHANDAIKICNADITVSAGDDGLHAGNDTETSVFYLESGSINITACYEGIEANTITMAGGTVNITPTDDGLNACGNGQNTSITISGGELTIINQNGQDADGIDSNGDFTLSGGTVFISLVGTGTNNAVDYGSESGGKFVITGGTMLACGAGQMVEAPEQSSSQGFVMQTLSGEANTTVSLLNSNGETLVSETVPCSFASVLVTAPSVAVGDTVTLKIGDSATEITVDNSAPQSSMGGGQGGQMGGGKGGMGGQMGGNQNGDTSGEQPQMPSGDTSGEMPQMPSGDTSGERPEMPSGDTSGEMPQMPSGDTSGEMPQMPSGDTSGEMPQMPSGDTSGETGGGFGGQTPPNGSFGGDTSGEMPQMPSGDTSGEMGGGFGGQTPPDGSFGDDTSGERPEMPSGDTSGEMGGGEQRQMPNGQQSQPTATAETSEQQAEQNPLELLFTILLSFFVLGVGLLVVYLKK